MGMKENINSLDKMGIQPKELLQEVVNVESSWSTVVDFSSVGESNTNGLQGQNISELRAEMQNRYLCFTWSRASRLKCSVHLFGLGIVPFAVMMQGDWPVKVFIKAVVPGPPPIVKLKSRISSHGRKLKRMRRYSYDRRVHGVFSSLKIPILWSKSMSNCSLR